MSELYIKTELENYKVKQVVESKLKKMQIPIAKQPKESIYKDFPDDVTDVPDRDLGGYLGVYEAESAWVKYLIARREIDLEYAQLLIDFVYSKIFLRAVGTATERKAWVQVDTFYMQCKKEFLEIDADLKMLYASLDAFERYSKAISREMSNRKNERDLYGGKPSLPAQQGVFHDHNSR